MLVAKVSPTLDGMLAVQVWRRNMLDMSLEVSCLVPVAGALHSVVVWCKNSNDDVSIYTNSWFG